VNGSSGETKPVMTTLPKTCLAVSAMGFVAGGIVDFGGFNVIPAMTVALPLGAIFFGMFMITLMMEREMAKFNEEAAGKLQLLKCDAAKPARKNEPGFVQGRDVSKTVSATVP
jgi:hypothetical protein